MFSKDSLSREQLEKTLRAGWDQAVTALDSGLGFVQDSWNKLPFFASVTAAVQTHGVPHDEPHYFLIPYRLAPEGYTLYSTRRLPDGVAEANDLPRRRVFHLPGPGGEETLTQLMVTAELKIQQASHEEHTKEFWGDRLNTLADEIDRRSQTVTGGVLLIGGLVALSNPLLGVGIATKALLPSVGAMLSGEGLRSAADRLKKWRQQREQERQEKTEAARAKEFQEDIKSIPVFSITNPLLQTLEKALGTDATQ